MTRYAVGDIQGCNDELQSLLSRLRFSADRDQIYFVGDLVNRGPASLEVLRFVHSLGDNAVVVLGNHDHQSDQQDQVACPQLVLETCRQPVGKVLRRQLALLRLRAQFPVPLVQLMRLAATNGSRTWPRSLPISR